MQIVVNGQQQPLDGDTDLSMLLEQLGYSGAGFAVALNGDFVARAHYAQQKLCDGDTLDIVAPVVGG